MNNLHTSTLHLLVLTFFTIESINAQPLTTRPSSIQPRAREEPEAEEGTVRKTVGLAQKYRYAIAITVIGQYPSRCLVWWIIMLINQVIVGSGLLYWFYARRRNKRMEEISAIDGERERHQDAMEAQMAKRIKDHEEALKKENQLAAMARAVAGHK
jgi:hypothetical protein